MKIIDNLSHFDIFYSTGYLSWPCRTARMNGVSVLTKPVSTTKSLPVWIFCVAARKPTRDAKPCRECAGEGLLVRNAIYTNRWPSHRDPPFGSGIAPIPFFWLNIKLLHLVS